MTKPAPRFDPQAIKNIADLVGPKCFARGVAYAEQGQIGILAIAEDRVIAEAYGTEVYSVRLTGAKKRIAGTCTCPAFDDSGFCKHMVAAMLVTNAQLEAGEMPDQICEGMAAFLARMSDAKLRSFIMELAETNSSLFRRLAFEAGLEPRWDAEFD
jgi:uncharacterized Zn finger protein